MNFFNLIENLKYNPSEIYIKLEPESLRDLAGMPTYLQFCKGLESAIYHNILDLAKLHYPHETTKVLLSNNMWHIVCNSKDSHHFIYKILKTFDDRAMEIYDQCIKGKYTITGDKIAEELDYYLANLIEELHLRKKDPSEHPRYKHKIQNFFTVTEHRDNYLSINYETKQMASLESFNVQAIIEESLTKAIVANCYDFKKTYYPDDPIYINSYNSTSINSISRECHNFLLKTLKEFADMSETIYYEKIQDKRINEDTMTNYLTTILSHKILKDSLPAEENTQRKFKYKL